MVHSWACNFNLSYATNLDWHPLPWNNLSTIFPVTTNCCYLEYICISAKSSSLKFKKNNNKNTVSSLRSPTSRLTTAAAVHSIWSCCLHIGNTDQCGRSLPPVPMKHSILITVLMRPPHADVYTSEWLPWTPWSAASCMISITQLVHITMECSNLHRGAVVIHCEGFDLIVLLVQITWNDPVV